MALSIAGIHPVWTRTTNDPQSPETSIFYRVLSATYQLEGVPQPRSQLRVPAPIPGVPRSRDMIDWDRKKQRPVDDDSSDEEERAELIRRRHKERKGASDDKFPPNVLWSQLYVPSGRWAFAHQQTIFKLNTLLELGVDGSCSVALKSGMIADTPVTYISRSWLARDRPRMTGFFRELALFKSSKHLRSLQGSIIPSLISVNYDGLAVSMAMEPPHHSFWMEASPDMPLVLKIRVLDAFWEIHDRGILHGHPELHNILIGGDGRVTLVNFQESYAKEEILAVGIARTDDAQLRLETREVAFKIDYADAREYESAKRERSKAVTRRNQALRKQRVAVAKGKAQGPVDDDEPYMADDLINPPVPDSTWQKRWIRDENALPRRFIVPGQTAEQVQVAFRQFRQIVEELEAKRIRDGQHAPHVQSLLDGPDEDDMETVLIGDYNVRKRKRSMSEEAEVEGPTSKRLRPETAEKSVAEQPRWEYPDDGDPYPYSRRIRAWTSGGPQPLHDDNALDLPLAASSPSVPSKEPIVRDYGAANGLSAPLPSNPYARLTSSVDELAAGQDLPRASTAPSRDPKVTDYGYMSYSGAKGYYVQHPPTEIRMEIERVRYIRMTNAEQADKMGLPYYRGDVKSCLPPNWRRSASDRPPGASIALGELKRKRSLTDESDQAWKKKGAAWYFKEDRELECIDSAERLDVTAHCEAITVAQWKRRAPPPPREKITWPGEKTPRLPSILKRSKPRRHRKLPQSKEFWTDQHEVCLSPKLGPPSLPVMPGEKRAILNSFECGTMKKLQECYILSELPRRRRRPADIEGASAPAVSVPMPSEGPIVDYGMPYETADDSAPDWFLDGPVSGEPVSVNGGPVFSGPVPGGPAPGTSAGETRVKIEDAVENLDSESETDEEYKARLYEWDALAIGYMSIGATPPPRPKRRHGRRQVQPGASRPSSSRQRRATPGPSQPSAPRQRQATPGPSQPSGSSPRRQRSSPTWPTGSRAGFSVPKLPQSERRPPKRKNGRARRSLLPPVVKKEEVQEPELAWGAPQDRPPCVPNPPKSIWQSLAEWFRG